MKNDKAAIWLYKNLENHTLSQKLSWLLSDKQHLTTCYIPNAYLCQEEYAEALLICLRAIERNHSSLLSDINPCLFLGGMEAQNYYKAHRRCFSFPEAHLKIMTQPKDKLVKQRTVSNVKISRLWRSLPNLQCSNQVFLVRKRSKSAVPKKKPSQNLDGDDSINCSTVKDCIKTKDNFKAKDCCKSKTCSKAKNSDKELELSNKKVKCIVVDNKEIIEHTPSPIGSLNSTNDYVNFVARSLPGTLTKPNLLSPKSRLEYNLLDSLSGLPGEKDYKKQPKKTFIEDGGMSVLPMSTGYYFNAIY